jgi:hypothetical protein
MSCPRSLLVNSAPEVSVEMYGNGNGLPEHYFLCFLPISEPLKNSVWKCKSLNINIEGLISGLA